jgi:hypothetical protein
MHETDNSGNATESGTAFTRYEFTKSVIHIFISPPFVLPVYSKGGLLGCGS